MKNSYGKISRSGGSKRDFSKKISSFRTVFRTQSLYLPQIWSSVRSQNDGMKRESGANPGQSRCCEAPRRYEHLSHWSARIGKASETGVSQKTCQIDSTSENLVDRVSDSGCKSHRLPDRRSFSCFPASAKREQVRLCARLNEKVELHSSFLCSDTMRRPDTSSAPFPDGTDSGKQTANTVVLRYGESAPANCAGLEQRRSGSKRPVNF